MVAPMVAAGIASGIGSVVGGITGGKGAKKAAKIQAQSTAQQLAALRENRDYQYGLNQGSIAHGAAADDRIAALLNLGGNADAARAGFDAYRDSTGYQFRLGEGMGAINSNAYARGMGESGATYKALLRYGQNAASDEFGRYLGQVGNVSQAGAQARGLVAGVGTNTVMAGNQALQTQADAQGNAAIIAANARAQALQGLMQAGARSFGSSWGGPAAGAAQPNAYPWAGMIAPHYRNG